VVELADKGYERALMESPALYKGLNIYRGLLTNNEVAKAFGLDYVAYPPA
jgi:alanine dehydrogenase